MKIPAKKHNNLQILSLLTKMRLLLGQQNGMHHLQWQNRACCHPSLLMTLTILTPKKGKWRHTLLIPLLLHLASFLCNCNWQFPKPASIGFFSFLLELIKSSERAIQEDCKYQKEILMQVMNHIQQVMMMILVMLEYKITIIVMMIIHKPIITNKVKNFLSWN